jgi:alkanesulfonate monooxygenase SsuD/methylene tetrahydromethanopterin reductase-like flavin-dependent oxidoreductase (luciferase family)
MTIALGTVAIGVAGALGPAAIADIARAVERAGLGALWVNDTPDGDALAALGAAASATGSLRLATGVVPLDRRPAPNVVRAVADAGIPVDRLTLGIGSGATRSGALDLVRQGAEQLRDEIGCRVVAGALGPRMRRLGAQDADGVLLSWLPPDAAREQSAEAHGIRASATVALYVRTAFDEAGRQRMRREAARYAGYPQYGANLARLGVSAHDTVLPTESRDVAMGLEEYRAAVDEVVLRAIVAEDTTEAYVAFVEQAAEYAGTAS